MTSPTHYSVDGHKALVQTLAEMDDMPAQLIPDHRMVIQTIRARAAELSSQNVLASEWQLVPVVPTNEMIEASCKLKLARIMDGRKCKGIERGVVTEYKAMLAAAPEPPKELK